MASKNVEVILPNARREKVKVDGSTTVHQILQQVCQKHGYVDSEFDLRHQRKILDVTSLVRFLNLANNAKLEMIQSSKPRKDSSVLVALQVENGARLHGDFDPDSSLYLVLKHFDDKTGSYARQDAVCVYMRQEYKGLPTLMATTLRSMGLVNGKAAIRLLFREPGADVSAAVLDNASGGLDVESASEMTFDTRLGENAVLEKMASGSQADSAQSECKGSEPLGKKARLDDQSKTIQSAVTSGDPVPLSPAGTDHIPLFPVVGRAIFPEDVQEVKKETVPPPPKPSKIAETNEFLNFKFPERLNDSSLDDFAIDPHKLKLEVRLSTPCERCAILYRLEEVKSTNGSRAEELEEGFFDVTVEDLRKRLVELKSRTALDEPLMTKAMREQKEMENIASYPQIAVRVFFPDRIVAQGLFRPLESVGALKEFVKSHLVNADSKFELFTTPPKVVLKDDRSTLYKARLFPAANVYISTSASCSLQIKDELLGAVRSYSEADSVVRQAVTSEPIQTDRLPGPDPQTPPLALSSSGRSEPAARPHTSRKTETSKEAPKWFKTTR